MGLDMYLDASLYISGWEHTKEEEKSKYRAILELLDLQPFTTKIAPNMHVHITVGYWRKANQIHNWFVMNAQDGLDECQHAPVSIKQLDDLDELCRLVLEDHSKAAELLPTMSGFFFGGTDYDEYYFDDLKHTRNVIEKCRLMKDFSFIYHSCW